MLSAVFKCALPEGCLRVCVDQCGLDGFSKLSFFLTFRCISQAETFAFALDLIDNKLAQFPQVLP